MTWYDYLNPVWDITQLVNDGGKAVSDWLATQAGHIASGIEAGFTFFLGDIFSVVIGPLEIAIGVILIVVAVFWAFKDEIGQMVNAIASVAAFAAK